MNHRIADISSSSFFSFFLLWEAYPNLEGLGSRSRLSSSKNPKTCMGYLVHKSSISSFWDVESLDF